MLPSEKIYKHFRCGNCSRTVKFESGVSDFIRCTCGKVNFVPNTGKYKDINDYKR